MTQLPVHLINLDRMPERLAHSRALAAERGFALSRIDAVDGRGLDPGRHARLTVGPIAGRKISPGELGCTLSHRAAWAVIARSGHSHGVVMEDDLLLSPDFATLLNPGWVPADADIVRLETFGSWSIRIAAAAAGTGHRRLHRLTGKVPGTGAYLVSRGAAARLLDWTYMDPGDPLDLLLFAPASPFWPRLVTYQMSPAPAVQGHRMDVETGEASTLYDERSDIRRGPPARWGRGRVWRISQRISAVLAGQRYVEIPFG